MLNECVEQKAIPLKERPDVPRENEWTYGVGDPGTSRQRHDLALIDDLRRQAGDRLGRERGKGMRVASRLELQVA